MTLRIQYVIPRILGAFSKLQKAIISFVTSSCPSVHLSQWNNLAPTRQTFMKFEDLRIFRKSVEKTQVSLETNRNEGQFTWRPIILLIISHPILLRIKNASDKVLEKIHTHTLFTVTFFRKSSLFYFISIWNLVLIVVFPCIFDKYWIILPTNAPFIKT